LKEYLNNFLCNEGRGLKMAKKLELGEVIGKGKRGVVRGCTFDGKKCAVKVPNVKSDAICRISNESYWLKRLNEYGIGPEFVYADSDVLVMEFLDGIHLVDYLKVEKDDEKIRKVFKKILKECRIMDKLKVNKLEMHRITKNAIVVGTNVVLIDFERCKRVLVPKNVTQFFQFLIKRGFVSSSKVLKDLRKYKEDTSEMNFKVLEKFV
jgi:putative serine/threonine protein kinase